MKRSSKRTWGMLVTTLALIVAACGPSQTPAPSAPTAAPAAPVAPTSAPVAPAPAVVPQPTAAPAALPKGGIFIDASFGEAVSMQPLITNDSASSSYQALLYAGLTRTDPETLDVLGNLYEGSPTLSADGTTLTWKLRRGLKWSDGKPITTKDIEFTWQKMIDPNVKFPPRKFYTDSFKDVKAIDETTVQYTLAQTGFCPAVRNSSLTGPIPMHVFEKLDLNKNDVNDKPSVVSGFFKFKEWVKDDHAVFGPGNADFVRGQPNLDSYFYRIVKDNTVATQLFKTQEIDFLSPNAVDWEEVSKLPHAQTFRYYSPAASWVYIGFNLRNPLFADKNVRQAISYAIDKKAMVEKIRLGFAKPQFSNIPASSWAYTDDVKKFEYDVAKAKALLKEAGWTAGADGILVKDGKPFKMRLEYNAGNNEREKIAVITQQFLKEVGIQADVSAVEWTAYLDKVTTKYDTDMWVLGWSGGIDPFSTGNIWKSEGSQNYTGYKNGDVDKWYDQAAAVPGCKQEDRKPFYAKIQQAIAEDQPYVFLYTSESLVAVNKKFKVNPLTKLGISYKLEEWAQVAR